MRIPFAVVWIISKPGVMDSMRKISWNLDYASKTFPNSLSRGDSDLSLIILPSNQNLSIKHCSYCRRSDVSIIKWMLEKGLYGPGVFRNRDWDCGIPKPAGYDH